MGFECYTVHALISWAKTHGYKTGSRIIGGWTDNSDHDYVVYAFDVMRLCQRLDDAQLNLVRAVRNPEYACAFASLKFGDDYVDGVATSVINLIVVDNAYDMLAWQYATEFCKGWKPVTKKNRLALFGDALRRAYRTMNIYKSCYWNALPFWHGVPQITE